MTGVPRIENPRGWTNRSLVHQPDPHRWRRLGLTALALTVALVPTLVYLWQQNECLRLYYRIAAMRERHDELVETERRLRFEAAAHESLDAIEGWALRERGLVRSAPESVVVVGDRRSRSSDLLARGR
jgi:hypothetical protein